MDIIVSDTNIFIDLNNIDLLDDFCRLSCHIHTTDMVIAEMKKNGLREKINKLVESKKITVKEHDEKDLLKIVTFYSSINEDCNLSLTDCSVMVYAKNNNFKLLTGDKKLRKQAESENVDVSGILFVMDLLLKENILSNDEYKKKLKFLFKTNIRLPKEEMESRLNKK